MSIDQRWSFYKNGDYEPARKVASCQTFWRICHGPVFPCRIEALERAGSVRHTNERAARAHLHRHWDVQGAMLDCTKAIRRCTKDHTERTLRIEEEGMGDLEKGQKNLEIAVQKKTEVGKWDLSFGLSELCTFSMRFCTVRTHAKFVVNQFSRLLCVSMRPDQVVT